VEPENPAPPPVVAATPSPAPTPPPSEAAVPVAAPETQHAPETDVTPTPPDKPRRETTRKKDKKADKADKPSGPPGFITIDSTPVYATIYIDGKKYGETPLVKQELPPGKHTVRAVSPSGAKRTLTITIVSGKTSPTRRIEW
jgi:serine/threonine-protein kinase